MKEAAKTSILSKSWRYIWTNCTDLDFDHLNIIPECNYYGQPTLIEAIKYVNWVNQVIRLHRGQSINKFRVQFCLYERQVHHIDRWVKFSLAKKVKNLELELPLYEPGEPYTLKPSLFESGISFLRCLRLTEVNVSGELLEFVLTECHLLEELFVERSDTLVSLKVASLKLKRLSIRICDPLKKLEIDAVNRCYLDYFGEQIIEFKSLPLSLAEAIFDGECCGATIPICQQIACFAMQLSKFSVHFLFYVPLVSARMLHVIYFQKCDFIFILGLGKYVNTNLLTPWLYSMTQWDHVICNIPAKSLPCFSNLKYLELTYWLYSMVDLPSIIRLLGACPVLCEVKMQVCWTDGRLIRKEARVLQGLEPLSLMNSNPREGNNYRYDDHSLGEERIEYKALPCLRVFQLVGFNGGDDDVNLILLIFNMAVQLHSFICHPLRPCSFHRITEDAAHDCRSRATKLQSYIPPKVNYVITNTYNPADML